MNKMKSISTKGTWTASELIKLPPKRRSAILRAAVEMAEEDYRIDPELTAFEAFGEDDLYGDSSNTQTRRNLGR